MVTPALTKEQQLKLFINLSHFGWRQGRPVVGLADAARNYLGKSAQALTDAEFLSLIAMLPVPARLAPVRNRAANQEGVERIRRLLDGICEPTGVFDIDLSGYEPG